MKNIILYLLFIVPVTLNAQSLSIEDLWNKISETNTGRQKQTEVDIAQQNLKIERLNRYPVVYGDANLQRNLIIPTTPVPAIAFDPNAQDGAILPLQFATKWNAKAGVQAEWKFFDPNRKASVEEKKLLAEKALINQKQGLQNLKKDATLAYTSVVLASMQYQAAIQDSLRYNQILQTAKLRYEAGREDESQYMLAMQEYERKKIQLYETWTVLCEADLELQKFIDLKSVDQLSSGIENILKALQGYQNVNYEAKLYDADMKLSDNDYKLFKRQLLPTVTLNAYYGAQFFNNSFRLFSSTNWFGNSYANIAIRLPLSAYLVQSPSVSKINAERQLSKLQLEESIKLDVIKQKQKLHKTNAAELKIQALLKIIDLSDKSLEKQKLAYEAGRIMLSDFNKSSNSLNDNLKELWQAQFDLISIYLN